MADLTLKQHTPHEKAGHSTELYHFLFKLSAGELVVLASGSWLCFKNEMKISNTSHTGIDIP
jgi:hypothetical protein